MATPMVTNLKKLHDAATRSDPVVPTQFRQLIGYLLYLVHTIPDICYDVSALSQFMSSLKHIHWIVVKHVLRYLRGTLYYGVQYTSGGGVMLHGFSDFDWAGSAQDRKSTFGFCFSLGSAMAS